MRSTIRSRPLDPARDREAVAALDASYATDVVHAVTATPAGFALVERPVRPPLHRRHAIDPEELAGATRAVVAEVDGRVVGVAALALRTWNRRAELLHLYVDAAARRGGVGRALLAAMREEAAALGARCLWAETQNVNVPAIRFYERAGFVRCGLDTSLYDPADAPGDVAIFMSLALA